MNRSGRLGLLGGTFDPIHFGHLDAADAARAALQLDYVQYIPAHEPPHRAGVPRVSTFHRFAMIALAIEGRAHDRASDLELTRHVPSFTVDTLRALREDGWAASQLFFVLGADAFAEIATWRAFPEVLDAANFAVIARPGMTLDAAVARTPTLRPRIRHASELATGGEGTAILLVEAHTRDISSTTIRVRLEARQPIDDLVPAAVARHIHAHELYGTVGGLHGEDERTRR